MSYTRNFGMRSFENIVRDGRFRVPRTGSALKIGSPVALDANNAGYLVAVVAPQAPGPNTGVLVFEHILRSSLAGQLASPVDPPYDVVPLGSYAQMIHGVGAKIWLRNTADKPLYDGRTQVGYAPVAATLSALKPGDGLAPAANGTWDAAGTDVPWLIVEQINPATGLVEARFTF